MSTLRRVLTLLLALVCLPQVLCAETTLAKVKAAGYLACGINREEPEYSNLDAHGNRALFDIDLCKATAIAVLGSAARFDVTAFPDEMTSLRALQEGKVDLIATATPSAASRKALGLAFGRILLFDYQGLMVNTTLGIHGPRDLAGRKICYLTETAIELNLVRAMSHLGIAFIPFPFQEEGELEAAFLTNNCAAISADVTQLAYERIAFRAKGLQYDILPDVLSMDLLASATRDADPEWSNLVNAVGDVLVQAEEAGVTAANVDAMKNAPDPAIRRLLGTTTGVGKAVGLSEDWSCRTIKGVGNYGEIFSRDLGPTSAMRLARGQNYLLVDGGLLTAPAF